DAGTMAEAVQPRSRANKPRRTAAISVGSSTMRPAASQAARPEPTATATEKIVKNSVTTSSLPPMVKDTSGGNSESTSAPTSQNQLATNAPHHSRGSARNCLISDPVETRTLRLIAKSGARDDRGADLGQLDTLGDERLIVAVRQLAAESGQKEKRRDQGGARNRDQDRRIGARHFVQDDEDQSGFEEIIAEGGEELAK